MRSEKFRPAFLLFGKRAAAPYSPQTHSLGNGGYLYLLKVAQLNELFAALLFSYSENAPPRRTPRELILSATAAIFIFLK